MNRISTFILTLNEESNIQDCIRSIPESNDIVVLDSFSTDRTVEIAESNGARVVQRKFDNWSAHQNWAVQNIEFKNDWVFYLDADERMTPELWAEVLESVEEQSREVSAFFCSRTNYFMGKPIPRVYPPVDIVRLFKPTKVRFERLVNPITIVDGKIGRLKNRFVHYNFSKGLAEWVDKHNKYSTWEAMEADKILSNSAEVEELSLFSRDSGIRRMALKNLSLKLPFRPLFKFAYLYFFRLGFLDGLPGLRYCTLLMFYEYLIDMKRREIELNRRGVKL